MKQYKAYLFDLDGTLYRGDLPIQTSIDFILKLHEKKIPYMFITNNSTKLPVDVAEKIKTFGIPCEAHQVITSSMVAVDYLKKHHQDQTVFAMGEFGLMNFLKIISSIAASKPQLNIET